MSSDFLTVWDFILFIYGVCANIQISYRQQGNGEESVSGRIESSGGRDVDWPSGDFAPGQTVTPIIFCRSRTMAVEARMAEEAGGKVAGTGEEEVGTVADSI